MAYLRALLGDVMAVEASLEALKDGYFRRRYKKYQGDAPGQSKHFPRLKSTCAMSINAESLKPGTVGTVTSNIISHKYNVCVFLVPNTPPFSGW
jgi:hypothetical protein